MQNLTEQPQPPATCNSRKPLESCRTHPLRPPPEIKNPIVSIREKKLNIPKFTLATLKEQTKNYAQNYGSATTAAIIGTMLGLYSNKLPNLDYSQLTNALPNSPFALRLYKIAPWVTVIWGIGTNEIALEQKEIQAQESYKHNPVSRQTTINSLKFASCAFLALGTYTIAKNFITQN